MTISEIIKQLSNDPSVEIYSAVGKVKSVDTDKRIADVELVHSENTMFECRLQSEIESTKGIAIIPKKDSFVIVTFISKNHAFISLTSEIEEIQIDFPKLSGVVDDINIKDTKIVLNDGNNGGIAKVKELADQIVRLEKQVNNILTALKSSTVALAPSGTFPFGVNFFSSINSIAPLTSKSDFENTDIKH